MTDKAFLNYTEVLSRLRSSLDGAASLTALGEVKNGSRSYPVEFLVLGPGNRKRVLISAGIHGDEPAGVETICALLERKVLSSYAGVWEISIIPCINPFGYEKATRTNHEDQDLNRHFKSANPPREVRLVQSVFRFPFDLTLELHEDVDSTGYYLYESGDADLTGSLPARILSEVKKVMPLNMSSEIDGSPASGGVISRVPLAEEMDWWPMALFARSQGARYCMTLETAPDFPMKVRVDAHINAIRAALEHFPG